MPPGESERAASEVAATLWSEACREPTTVTRQGRSGSCRPTARLSLPRRAAHNGRFHNTGIKRFHPPVVGALVLSFDDELSANAVLTMAVYTAQPGSP